MSEINVISAAEMLQIWQSVLAGCEVQVKVAAGDKFVQAVDFDKLNKNLRHYIAAAGFIKDATDIANIPWDFSGDPPTEPGIYTIAIRRYGDGLTVDGAQWNGSKWECDATVFAWMGEPCKSVNEARDAGWSHDTYF